MSHGNTARRRASVPCISARAASLADAPERNAKRLEFAPPAFARNKYRVLVAHDLTAASEIALVRAARLAAERDGHLTVLHVVASDLATAAIESRRAQAADCLETQVRRWLGRGSPSCRIDIGVGDPAGAVAARAQAHDVDLVVTGRHRARAFRDRFSRGVVGRLLLHIRRPLLMVGNADQSPYRRVLIPIDSTDDSASGLRFAADFLPRASLRVLHVCGRGFGDRIASLSLGLGGRRATVTAADGDVLPPIKQELARQKTDLLVLGAPMRGSMRRLPIWCGTDDVARSAACDVLFAVPHPES
jgi:nucleotide-binding universal stress UspA family protein